MRRILLATDLSGMGEALVAVAVDLARALSAGLDVLHVCSIDDFAEVQQATGIALDQHIDNLRGRVQETVTRIGPLPPRVQVKVIPGGSISEGILTAADSLKADIIVMGSHSRTGLARVILGSVAESVLRRARVPVLIVPVAALEASQRQAVVSSQAI